MKNSHSIIRYTRWSFTKAEDIGDVKKPAVFKDASEVWPIVVKASAIEQRGARGWMSEMKKELDSVGLSRIVRFA